MLRFIHSTCFSIGSWNENKSTFHCVKNLPGRQDALIQFQQLVTYVILDGRYLNRTGRQTSLQEGIQWVRAWPKSGKEGRLNPGLIHLCKALCHKTQREKSIRLVLWIKLKSFNVRNLKQVLFPFTCEFWVN